MPPLDILRARQTSALFKDGKAAKSKLSRLFTVGMMPAFLDSTGRAVAIPPLPSRRSSRAVCPRPRRTSRWPISTDTTFT